MDCKVIASICEDTAFIKHVIWSIWDETCDDGSKGLEATWNPAVGDVWVLISCGEKRLGVYRLRQFNGSTFQVCANILPKYRKKYTFDVTKAFHDFLLAQMPEQFTKFIAFIPEYFENVISYANKSGWQTEAKIKQAFTRDGTVYDTACVGITRKELAQWAQ